jgi:hypothetical protein
MANTRLIFLSSKGETELSTFLTSENEISICIDIPTQFSGVEVVFDKETAIEFLNYLHKEISYLKD